MKVKCIVLKLLDKKYELIGGMDNSNYLTLGGEYEVLGIHLYKGFLRYLIYDETKHFRFEHKDFFEIIDNRIPGWWKIKASTDLEYIKEHAEMRIAYPEIVESPQQHDDLISNQTKEAYAIALKEIERLKEFHTS